MTDRRKIFLPLLVLAVGIIITVVIVRSRPDVERVEAETSAPLVRVIEVERHDLRLSVASQGTVQPRSVSSLVAQVAGLVESVAADFADGAFFRHGDVLVRIDPRDYELAVAQADAQVAQARVRVDVEEAEAAVAREEWQSLGSGEPTALTLREPQMAEARAALQAAEAHLEQARLALERTVIRAPFAGRIREKKVDVGQFVAPGTPLAVVFATDAAEVRLPVAQRDLAYLDIDLGLGSSSGAGPEVRLTGRLGGTVHTWNGRIVRTGSEFDPKSRMLPLYARVDDPFGLQARTAASTLPMGLFVQAEIVGIEIQDIVTLPRTVLRGEDQVLVVDDESRLRFRAVEIYRTEGAEVLIRSGLEEGEQVCVSLLETVVDGMEVRVRTSTAPTEATTAPSPVGGVANAYRVPLFVGRTP